MKKHSYLIELLIFFILTAIVISGMYNIVRYKNVGSGGGMDNFYDTKVPIDVIIYGSSHAACTVNNGIFWKDYGIASYTLSAGGQNLGATYYFLQESIAENKPKIALIETYLLTKNDFTLESYYRSALTSKFSTRFLSYTLKAVKDNSIDRQTAEDMLFRMPIVHSRYNELEKSDYVRTDEYIRGYRGDNASESTAAPQRTDRLEPIDEDALEYVDKMISLCRENGVEPVFFNAPYSIDEISYAQQNTLCKYVEEKGCKYLAFNRDSDSYGIDYDNDFRDPEHLNDTGAAKVTTALANYIRDNFHPEDKRGKKGYELWDKHLVYLADKALNYELSECETLEKYLECVCNHLEDKTYVLSLNGNYRAMGDEIYKPYLEQLGIDFSSYEQGGVWIIKNAETVYLSDDASKFIAYRQLGKSTDLNIIKSEEDEFPHIILDDADLSPDCNGISILVFDETCEYPINAMQVDLYQSTDIINISLDE